MKRIDQAVKQQLDLNKTKNMLYSRLDQLIEIDPDFLAALEEVLGSDREALTELALQDAISSVSRMLLQRLYSVNQFLQISEPKRRQLESIYLRTWRRIVETKNIEATLRDYHYPELTRWIAALYPKSFLEQLRNSPIVGHVICEEYSAQLQIELLRIDVESLKQPLLDIGCGGTAGLVQHLRTFQIESYGIDRRIELEASYVQEMNWFDYGFEPNTWGTIISNMSFTNHLLYTYHHDSAQLKLYLHKFTEIIGSLKIGGSFHYAPSVPFVEQMLDVNSYRVRRLNVVKEICMTRIMRIAN